MDAKTALFSSCKGCLVVAAAATLATWNYAAPRQGDRTMDRNHTTIQQCTYRISHPALGPVRGTDVIRIRIRQDRVEMAFSLRDGHVYATHEPIPGANKVLETLQSVADPADAASTSEIVYLPGTHASGVREGGGDGAVMRILSCWAETNPKVETIDMARKAFLRYHMNQWHKRQPKSYRFKLTDSRLRSRYLNGIEMTVANQTAVSAIDVWSQKPIDHRADLPFQTLDDVYRWIDQRVEKDGIVKMVIDYDDRWGYPVFIEWSDKDQETHTVMITQFKE